MKEERERRAKMEEERRLSRERIVSRNQEIKEKNKLRINSGSPTKHKYDWGVDQKKLETKPQSRESGTKWQKKESPKRREELGLGHLNSMDEEKLKKLKENAKINVESTVKKPDEKTQSKIMKRSKWLIMM